MEDNYEYNTGRLVPQLTSIHYDSILAAIDSVIYRYERQLKEKPSYIILHINSRAPLVNAVLAHRRSQSAINRIEMCVDGIISVNGVKLLFTADVSEGHIIPVATPNR